MCKTFDLNLSLWTHGTQPPGATDVNDQNIGPRIRFNIVHQWYMRVNNNNVHKAHLDTVKCIYRHLYLFIFSIICYTLFEMTRSRTFCKFHLKCNMDLSIAQRLFLTSIAKSFHMYIRIWSSAWSNCSVILGHCQSACGIHGKHWKYFNYLPCGLQI